MTKDILDLDTAPFFPQEVAVLTEKPREPLQGT